jgi:glycosyltransferase involved in cell wall biosynthesis
VVVAIHFDVSQADEWAGMGRLRRGGHVYNRIAQLERHVLPRVDGIVYVSESARRGVSTHVSGVEQVRSAVIPNFVVDVPSSCSLDASASTVSTTADLVAIGGLLVRKNQRFLLAVIHAANQLGRRLTIDIIGDGPCRRELMRLAQSLGVDDQVRFLGLRLDARRLLPGHRVFVHAATHEAFGIVIIEAMGSGLPVVTGEAGGMTEVFDPGVEGLFWPLDDPQTAARMLIDLLEDEPRLATMSTAARARFERNFDARVVVPQLERFLRTTPPNNVTSVRTAHQRRYRP